MGNIVMNSNKPEILFILLYFQLSGLTISILLLYIRNCEDNRIDHLLTHQVVKSKRANTQSLIDYFQKHPRKIFKQMFPDIFRLAMATKRYKRINSLRNKGLLNAKQYERKLNRILPEVDISSELHLTGFK